MGRNAQRRRTKTHNGRVLFESEGDVGLTEEQIRKVFRSSCSQCGSTDIKWQSLGELISESEDKSKFDEVLSFFPLTAHAWTCLSCPDGMGIMP